MKCDVRYEYQLKGADPASDWESCVLQAISDIPDALSGGDLLAHIEQRILDKFPAMARVRELTLKRTY